MRSSKQGVSTFFCQKIAQEEEEQEISIPLDPKEERFQMLYEKHYPRVVGYFFRAGFPLETREDLTQETFVRVFPHVDKIRGTSDGEEISYILTVAANVRANFLRAKGTLKRTADEVPIDDAAEQTTVVDERAPSPEDELIEKDERSRRKRQLANAIEQLDELYRVPLVLQLEECTMQEIADTLGLNLNTAKSRVHQARQKIRELIDQEPNWPPDDGDSGDRDGDDGDDDA